MSPHRHLVPLLPVLCIVACVKTPPQPLPGPGSLPSFEQFRAAQSIHTYHASPERRGAVFAGLSTVVSGMAKHEVAAALGHPDWSTEVAPKDRTGYLGTEWTYLLSSDNLSVANEATDQRLLVFFSPVGRLTRVRPVNIKVKTPAGV